MDHFGHGSLTSLHLTVERIDLIGKTTKLHHIFPASFNGDADTMNCSEIPIQYGHAHFTPTASVEWT
jgi:hypothetical protein